jgi:hypothetical protein
VTVASKHAPGLDLRRASGCLMVGRSLMATRIVHNSWVAFWSPAADSDLPARAGLSPLRAIEVVGAGSLRGPFVASAAEDRIGVYTCSSLSSDRAVVLLAGSSTRPDVAVHVLVPVHCPVSTLVVYCHMPPLQVV